VRIAGYSAVGSACAATNKGFIHHPEATEQEIKTLEDIFKVKGASATINTGIPFVGRCVIANSNGFVVGTQTTGYELGRLEEGFGFIEG